MEQINLNSIKKGNVFKGFGSSLAWFANIIGKSDDKESVDKLCDILFNKKNPNGLYLNFIRYNIGASDTNIEKNFRNGGAIEAYTGTLNTKGVSGQSNWDTIDLGQRYFLKKAKEHGVEHFEAFSNSPPWYMTKSGSTAGSAPWNIPFVKQNITFSNNLKSECVDEFSKYLVDVTKYLYEHDGINFSSISCINEPSGPGWQKNNNQEGCFYTYNMRRKLFKSLIKELNSQGMKDIVISGPDENSMLFSFLSLILNPFNTKYIEQFNCHRYRWGNVLNFNTYGFEDSNIFRRLIRWILGDKPIVMAEFGLGLLNGITDSKDFQNVLLLADKIMDDFIYLNPILWCYWQCFDSNGWGLCEVNSNDPSKVSIGALYKAMQHFSHFIKPGHQLLELPKLKNKNLKWIGSQYENEISLVILSKESSDITLEFNQYLCNTNISISNSNNFVCDNNLIKTKFSSNINSLIIPSCSLVSISFTI